MKKANVFTQGDTHEVEIWTFRNLDWMFAWLSCM